MAKVGSAWPVEEKRAREIALAYSQRRRITKWFGAAKPSDFAYAIGHAIQMGYTEQRVWLESRQREVKFLATERALNMPRSEPLAPEPFTDASVEYLIALGDLVDCPTCAGLGKTTCKKCNGQARVKCRRCAHLPNYTPSCSNCSGSRFVGQVPCESCGGTGHEVPCRECRGERIVPCSDCVGVGLRTCEMCEGISRAYKAEVETVNYASKRAVDWHVAMPQEVLNWLYTRLPMTNETYLEKPSDRPEVLQSVRLEYEGVFEIIHLRRLLSATVVFVNGEFLKLSRAARKQLPAFLQPPSKTTTR